MKQLELQAVLTIYDTVEELPDTVQQLMQEAIQARANAYAPYSKFQVGAAVLLEDNTVVIGNNQENAAYPSGLCAERVAIFQAGARFPEKKMLKIALTASSDTQTLRIPTPPCGACRQAIAEYEVKQDSPIEIYFMGEKGKVVKADSIKALLPLVFDQTYL